MEPYNFWQEFFGTYQALSDWVKALWLVVPPGFVLALVATVMWFRMVRAKGEPGSDGTLVYSVHRDMEGHFHIVSHAAPRDNEPSLMLVGPKARENQVAALRPAGSETLWGGFTEYALPLKLAGKHAARGGAWTHSTAS